uniref:Uncharacterized protein n=1 Tax=Cucumis melo TaxID=3656 RepID=A0A9I9EAJ4_CUCME
MNFVDQVGKGVRDTLAWMPTHEEWQGMTLVSCTNLDSLMPLSKGYQSQPLTLPLAHHRQVIILSNCTTRKWRIPDAEKHVGIKNVGNKGFPDALNNASGDASGKPPFPTHHEGVGKHTSGKGVFPDAVNSASGAASGKPFFPTQHEGVGKK